MIDIRAFNDQKIYRRYLGGVNIDFVARLLEQDKLIAAASVLQNAFQILGGRSA
jgi:hypothetical protein